MKTTRVWPAEDGWMWVVYDETRRNYKEKGASGVTFSTRCIAVGWTEEKAKAWIAAGRV